MNIQQSNIPSSTKCNELTEIKNNTKISNALETNLNDRKFIKPKGK